MGEMKLPEGWKVVKIKDITELITKGTTPTTIGYNYTNEGVNFVKIESITNNGEFLIDKMAHISEECNNKMIRSQLKENDIVFSIAGAIGRTAMVNKEILPANTNQALAIIRLNTDEVSTEFLLKCLRSEYIFKQFEKKKQGVAQLNLSLKDISELELMYPSKLEQKNIVTILNRAQKAIDKRRESLRLLDELTKSRFIEMFGDPIKNNKGWDKIEIGDMFQIKTGATPSRKENVYWENGNIPWVKTTELKEYVITETEEYITEEGFNNSSVNMLPKNTILVAMYGQGKTRGMTGKLGIEATTNQACAAILPNENENMDFVWYQLRLLYNDLRDLGRGGNQPNLNTNLVKGYELIFPPIELQNQFSAFVNQVDKLKFEMQQSLTELENNFNSLMQKAFNGELFN
jgi:type I restriction enzyme S subunit